jgi:polysaccharide biosynthesis protein PslH
MRILFVSTNLPVPANNGQAIRTLSIVRALASIGHKLTFVSFAPDPRPAMLEPLSSCCRKIDLLGKTGKLTNVSAESDYLGRLVSLLSRTPYSIERFRSVVMRKRIEEHLRQDAFDFILCDSIYALVNVPNTSVPIALNCHNVEHVIFERYAQIEKSLARKWYAGIESRLVGKAERQACHRAALAMACSENDRSGLRRLHPRLPLFVVPNTVDTDCFSSYPNQSPEKGAPVVLFQGGMDWYPNRDAVDYFAQSILPLVRSECPNVKFVVAGRNPPIHFVERYHKDGGIEFTGTVPDMRPYLSMAAVVVVPLRLGGGTRIKILEAGAAGKAVVSTRVGAEGLSLEHGKDILLADHPSEFAYAVIEMLRDAARRQTIGSAARAVVFERYSQTALERSLAAVISSFSGSGFLKPMTDSAQSRLRASIR